jgi:hypothetical protein
MHYRKTTRHGVAMAIAAAAPLVEGGNPCEEDLPSDGLLALRRAWRQATEAEQGRFRLEANRHWANRLRLQRAVEPPRQPENQQLSFGWPEGN